MVFFLLGLLVGAALGFAGGLAYKYRETIKLSLGAARRELATRDARKRIERACVEQLDFEEEHVASQEKRLLHFHRKGALGRRHGEYDADQRVDAIEIRVRHSYRGDRTEPPENLHELVVQALGGAE